MNAFKNYLSQMVERYDGDGQNDMPGLKIPIKYWEIMNEPTMQGGSTGGMGEELKFFVGTPAEYVDILKASYQTIKAADPEAKVLHAGMAGMNQNFQDFWDQVFALNIGDYFDIANIHTISTDEYREDLYAIKFKAFLEKYNLGDKPIWITEVQFGSLTEKPENIDEFDRLMARATIFSLAQGADKLFYIENWFYWDNVFEEKKTEDEGEKKEFIKDVDTSNQTHQVYLNLVDKINSYDRIETIKEEYTEGDNESDGAQTIIGQYKFIAGNQTIYVFWGDYDLPEEITGEVTVTDIYGQAQLMDASRIVLTDSPIFVEI
jgi:hypothetical protein